MKKNFEIDGMTCTACAIAIENTVSKIDGIEDVAVNYATEEMSVTFKEGLDEEIIKEQVKNAGYSVVDNSNKTNSNSTNTDKSAEHQKEMKARLINSLIFAIPLFYLTMGGMVGLPIPAFFKGDQNSLIFAFTQVLLTIPVMIIGKRYYKTGFKTMIKGAPNMDSLIAMGTGVAFTYGLIVIYILMYAFSRNDVTLIAKYSHKLYFESTTTILTLITLGKYLEARAKSQTSAALTALINLQPSTATVIRDGKELVLNTSDIVIGDILILKPGSSVAVDGVVVSGLSTIDESMLTGESMHITKEEGDNVYCGTINQTGSIKYRATKISGDTMLSNIITLVKDAQATKAPIARLADKVAAVFVPTVIAIAILAFTVWMILGYDFEFALNIAVSILVISCPCALGLATPTAIMVSTGISAKNGVLFKTAQSLETLHKADTIVFDKTGTLTKGEIRVSDYEVFDDNVLSYIYSLEKYSEHPLAKAVYEFSKENGAVEKEVKNFIAKVGYGVHGEIDDKKVFVGNKKYLLENNVIINKDNDYEKDGKTKVYIAWDNEIKGIFGLADIVKDEAEEVVKRLKSLGKKVVMITGDSFETGNAIASFIGIEKENTYTQILPEQKSSIVEELKKSGTVVMVGDGINDAVALANADIGIAVSSGTDVAIETADVVLMKNNLDYLLTAISLSEKTIAKIKQNLFFAFIYNIIGIPIAAGVFFVPFGLLLNPMIGALAMSMSSVSVVTNALTLKRFKAIRTSAINDTENETNNTKIRKEVNKMKKELSIEGMMCMHCVGRVEKALSELEGVSEVNVNLEAGEASVEVSDKVSDEILTKAVTDAGYPANIK